MGGSKLFIISYLQEHLKYIEWLLGVRTQEVYDPQHINQQLKHCSINISAIYSYCVKFTQHVKLENQDLDRITPYSSVQILPAVTNIGKLPIGSPLPPILEILPELCLPTILKAAKGTAPIFDALGQATHTASISEEHTDRIVIVVIEHGTKVGNKKKAIPVHQQTHINEHLGRHVGEKRGSAVHQPTNLLTLLPT